LKPSIRKFLHLGILACFQIVLLSGVCDLHGEEKQDRDKFIVAVKGICSAADAYRIKLALSRLEGIEKVRFLIEGDRFRSCCTVSEEYNRYLKSLESVPMAVFTKGVSANEVLDFLKSKSQEQSFEVMGE
jgi:hypothetical protein